MFLRISGVSNIIVRSLLLAYVGLLLAAVIDSYGFYPVAQHWCQQSPTALGCTHPSVGSDVSVVLCLQASQRQHTDRWRRRQQQQCEAQVGGPVEEAATWRTHRAQGQVNALSMFCVAAALFNFCSAFPDRQYSLSPPTHGNKLSFCLNKKPPWQNLNVEYQSNIIKS